MPDVRRRVGTAQGLGEGGRGCKGHGTRRKLDPVCGTAGRPYPVAESLRNWLKKRVKALGRSSKGCGGEGAIETIDELQERIERCRICRDDPLGTPLGPEPNPILVLSATARICIAGQAPGTRADRSRIPFSDPSGDRLRAWMGIEPPVFYDRSRVAIVPMGFCFPGLDRHGGDLPPRRECRATWHETVFDRMPQLELILLIGGYAQRWHARRAGLALAEGGVGETVRSWRSETALPVGPQLIPLPHPSWRNNAWLKRNPWFETERLPELRRLVAKLT